MIIVPATFRAGTILHFGGFGRGLLFKSRYFAAYGFYPLVIRVYFRFRKPGGECFNISPDTGYLFTEFFNLPYPLLL